MRQTIKLLKEPVIIFILVMFLSVSFFGVQSALAGWNHHVLDPVCEQGKHRGGPHCQPSVTMGPALIPTNIVVEPTVIPTIEATPSASIEPTVSPSVQATPTLTPVPTVTSVMPTVSPEPTVAPVVPSGAPEAGRK